MANLRDLERTAREAEAAAAAASAAVSATRDAAETPLQKSMRLGRVASDARKAADKERKRFHRRVVWIAVRLFVLWLLLWGAWRIGYEHGDAVSYFGACPITKTRK